MGMFGVLKKTTKGALKGTPVGSAFSAAVGGFGEKKKRRRKPRLTQGDLMELTHVKTILGRTAAANALPYYLGRGRG